MNDNTVTADYLVIGAGAMGMAFADVLMTDSEASIIIVDRHHRPGGHWNDAYPYVRLHQPSSFYGVNSRQLGSNLIDQTGLNKGLYELASGAEVCTYFDQVMQQQFLPSGRVQYFPMCEYNQDGTVTSRVSGHTFRVKAGKVVDATYMHVTVPSVRPPQYAVAESARCVPLNELVKVKQPPDGYVIVGAGKTAMDACLFLLQSGADPDQIRWIMPRDSWILNRASLQPGDAPARREAPEGNPMLPMDALAQVKTVDDLFDALDDGGQLLRLDKNVRPRMYRCATVTLAELEQLRRISKVVRLGRVQRISENEIVLQQGSIPTSTGTLHVDCSADGLERRPVVRVFDGDRITLQTVRTCQQVFSAAMIAYVELSEKDDAEKNTLCTVVPHPNTDRDWLRTTLANLLNQLNWSQKPDLMAWLSRARLDVFTQVSAATPQHPASAQEGMEQAMAALGRLHEFVQMADAEESA